MQLLFDLIAFGVSSFIMLTPLTPSCCVFKLITPGPFFYGVLRDGPSPSFSLRRCMISVTLSSLRLLGSCLLWQFYMLFPFLLVIVYHHYHLSPKLRCSGQRLVGRIKGQGPASVPRSLLHITPYSLYSSSSSTAVLSHTGLLESVTQSCKGMPSFLLPHGRSVLIGLS